MFKSETLKHVKSLKNLIGKVQLVYPTYYLYRYSYSSMLNYYFMFYVWFQQAGDLFTLISQEDH